MLDNYRDNAPRAQGDLLEALAGLDQEIPLDPEFAVTFSNRGIARAAQGDLVAAIADYTRAIELDPQFAGAYVNRGLAYREQGDRDKAIADFQKVLELSADPYWREQVQRQLKVLEGVGRDA